MIRDSAQPAADRRRRSGPRRPRGDRPALSSLAAAVLVLGLSACGSEVDPERDTASNGIKLPGGSSSSQASGSATSAPSSEANSSPTSDPGEGAPPVTRTVLDTGAELEVEDQRGSGSAVRVAAARLTVGSGWVVVVDPAGRMLLGSTAVPTTGGRDLLVPVSPRTRPGDALLALLYADDGDGRFDPDDDGRVVDEDGESQAAQFTHQPPAPVRDDDDGERDDDGDDERDDEREDGADDDGGSDD